MRNCNNNNNLTIAERMRSIRNLDNIDVRAKNGIILPTNQNISGQFQGYTPQQIRNAYSFDSNYNGEGQTIAIIDAYGNPNIVSDLEVFNREFGLPSANLQVVYPQGRPTTTDSGWALETSLDVQWIHALAPAANILLVIAQSSSFNDLFSAVDYAVSRGVNIISMSWGSPEFPAELSYNYHFSNPNITFVAASGDNTKELFPSTANNVISVGGTTVSLDANGNRTSEEIAWRLSSGGLSAYQPRASFQCIRAIGADNQPLNDSNMAPIPDVSFYASANPGVVVYTSVPSSSGVGFLGVGGSSYSCAAWAAIIADATPSGRRLNALETIYNLAGGGSCSYTNPYNAYRDIIRGNNGTYYARVGYDYVTGLGSPIVSNFIPAFRNAIG